jgi:hypothetical protein
MMVVVVVVVVVQLKEGQAYLVYVQFGHPCT